MVKILRQASFRESRISASVTSETGTALAHQLLVMVMFLAQNSGVIIALMEPVGYIPMASLYMLFNMFYMCERKAWKPVLFVIVAVAVALATYFLFRQFVYVRLPAGILKGVLG